MTGLRDRMMVVLWPSFLMAGVLEMIVFAFVDPWQLHRVGGEPAAWSSMAVYTVAFFVFWVVIGIAGALVLLLGRSAVDVNSRSYR